MRAKMNSVAAWSRQRPIAACFALVALYIVFRRISHFLFMSLLPQSGVTKVLYEITDVIWPFWMVALFGYLDAYRKGSFFRTLLAGLSLLLYAGFNFVGNIATLSGEPDLEWQTPLMVFGGILSMLAVGFREESVFRGIAANVLAEKYLKDRRGVLFTAFAGAAFFGIMHMQNVFVGQSFMATVSQTVNAFFLGSVLVAAYLRGGSLWAMMLIHGFFDLSLMVRNLFTRTYASDAVAYLASRKETTVDPVSIALKAGMYLIYFLIALFLLRKSKCDEIIKRYQSGE